MQILHVTPDAAYTVTLTVTTFLTEPDKYLVAHPPINSGSSWLLLYIPCL